MVSINDIVNYHVYAKNPKTGRVISKSEAKNTQNAIYGIRAQDPVTGRIMSQAEAGKRVKSYIGKCLKERPEVSAAAIDERLGINKGESELQKSLRKAENRKAAKGTVTATCPFEPFKGAKIPVTPETAEWWKSFGYKDANPIPVVKPTPNLPALIEKPTPKPTPAPIQAPVEGPKPNPAPGPKPTPAPIQAPVEGPKPNPAPGPKPTPAPGPKPNATPKSGFFGKLGKFGKKLGKWGIPLLLLAGAAYLLKDCKGCSNGAAPVAPANPEKDCKATAKEDVTKKEIKNIAYKMQAGDRLDKVIEAKYGIKDPEQNKKVREYIREQMGLPKSGQDASGKTIIPRIEQKGKTLYDAYYFPEQLPKELGGAKYQDNKVQKSKYDKTKGVSQEAKNKTRTEKTSNGYKIITTCKKADGSVETSVAATGLTKEEADKIVKEMNK